MTAVASPLRIVVVEDNDTLRDLLVSYLDQPGRKVSGVDCGEALNALLGRQWADIVILDLNLPYEDGLRIAQRLRRSHPQTGIVMLTARVRAADRTAGYAAGADVYLTKPTNVTELEAVVRNLAARRQAPTAQGFTLNRAALVFSSPQQKQTVLTGSEAAILEALALGPGEGLDVESLLAALRRGGNPQLSRDNLSVIVSRLRNKIETQLGEAQAVITVRRFGYRLGIPVALI